MPQTHLEPKRRAVLASLLEHVELQAPLVVLKAPPGSGKTFVTTYAIALAWRRRMRVAVATQTNAQSDDLCRRMAEVFPSVPVVRFASAGRVERPLGPSVRWCRASAQLPAGPAVVVATTAKWAASKVDEPYDALFVDEAWQMCWADFMLMSKVAARFVLVGDPGQIAPVVPVDVSRWQTSRRPPHLPAPEVILRDRTLPTRSLALPVTTRLPHDTLPLVRAFYDFDFDSWAGPSERRLLVAGARPGESSGADGAIDLLTTGSVALLSLPTPASGPPLEEDDAAARAAAAVVKRLVERGAEAETEAGRARLLPSDIGVSATHRVLNTRVAEALGPLAAEVRVDTPERWQGLQRKVMVVVHPLSGMLEPSGFDLSTGRLCVMTSRHEVGLVLVARDHLRQSLLRSPPRAEQPLGQPDDAGRGHARHLAVLDWLERGGRVVSSG